MDCGIRLVVDLKTSDPIAQRVPLSSSISTFPVTHRKKSYLTMRRSRCWISSTDGLPRWQKPTAAQMCLSNCHRASLDCLGDRFSIVVIVLLPLHAGLGVDRRDGGSCLRAHFVRRTLRALEHEPRTMRQ